MSKETSLASQLRKLKAPQTNVFNETRVKISFLYDPKDAFTIDKDSHFGIAVNSFHAICQIDPTLEEFENIFFNLASKQLDRGMLSPKEAESLNYKIRKFLFKVVTPYFLLQHTHKMLEWLVFKYLVHDYNTDDLILSVLPYHETKLFARVVQLCSKIRQPTNKWHWLLEIQNQGVPLSKSKLFHYCSSQQFIVRTLIDEIVYMVKQNYNIPILISFVTSTLINLVERDPNSNLITIVIYYLTKGFKSNNLSFIISSYTIFAHLSTKISFKDFKLEKLINKMCKYYSRSSLQSVIETDFYLSLAVVYKYQEITSMSDITLSVLDIEEVIKTYKNVKFYFLISALLCKLINSCSNEEYYFGALKILNCIELNKLMIKNILITISKTSFSSEDVKLKLREILAILERGYPLQFDIAIQEINSLDFHDLLVSSMYARLNDINENIWTALIHSNSKIRLLASIHIQKNLETILNTENKKFQEIISSSLTNTWNESYPLVLIEILSCKKLFLKFISQKELFAYGKRLLSKCSESLLKCSKTKDFENFKNWLVVQEKCLNLVQKLDLSDEQFLNLYGNFFLALDDINLELIKTLFESCTSTNQLHLTLKQSFERKINKYINEKNYESIIDLISFKIASYLIEHSNLTLLHSFSEPGTENFRQNVFCLCILYHLFTLVEKNQFHFVCNKMIEIFSSLFKNSKISFYLDPNITNLKSVIVSTHHKLIKNSLSVGFVKFFLSYLIDSFTIENNDDIWFWHRIENENHFLLKLFNFLCEQVFILPQNVSSMFNSLLSSFLKKAESNCPTFITSQWSFEHKPLNQFQALSIGSDFILNYNLTDIDLLFLFMAFHSQSLNNRELAANLVRILSNKKKDKFLTILSDESEFLKNDANKINFLLANYHEQRNKDIDFKNWLDLIIKCILRDDIPINIQFGLINFLKEYNLSESFNLLIPVFQKLLKSNNLNDELCSLLSLKLINALSSRSNLQTNDPLWVTFIDIMNNVHFRHIMLRHFNSQQVKEFSSNSMMIVCFLLDIIIETNDKIVLKKLKKFLDDGLLVANVINSLTMTNVAQAGPVTRKRRKTLKRIEFSIESSSWKKTVILLDLLLTRESFFNSNELLATLFDLLKESFISEEKSALEYFRYLLLSNIDLCLNQEDLNFQVFDIQFIFEALRHSRQRETQRAALIIVNKVSSHFKDEILHNIMTIFSYIGDNMIKCDDQYTHKLLDDTMDVIIKNMVESKYASQSKIIEIFIDAMDDIPAHRRLYLFNKLTSLLGEIESLWYISLKLSENGIYSSKDGKHRLELNRALICSFKCTTQLITLRRLMDCIDTIDQKGYIKGRYNEIVFKEKDKHVIIFLITQVVQLVVSSDEFVTSIAINKWSDLKNYFAEFLESLLSLIAKVSKKDLRRKSFSSMRLAASDLFKILEKVNHLLPFKELSNVLHVLLKSNSCDIRRKAMDLLNSRLTSDFSIKNKVSLLRTFIEPLQSIIEEVKINNAENILINSQTALLSIKLIAKLLKNDTKSVDFFKKVLNSILFIINETEEINVNFLASSLLCSTALAISLQQNGLSFISLLMSIILKTLINKCDIVMLSSVTALSKLIHYFYKFLSPYLTEILVKLCLIYTQSIDSSLKNKIEETAKNIASLVQIRLLIPSFENAYDQLFIQNIEALQFLFSIVNHSLSNANQTVLETNLLDLQRFIIKALDHRFKKGLNSDDQSINAIENKCIESIVIFVPKLSETSFRPFFYKIYDWFILSKDTNQPLRLVTFYRLINRLVDVLKSLFCAFAAPYIVNNCLQQLQLFSIYQDDEEEGKKSINFDEKIAHLIIINILSTLGKCFLYDINSSFSSKERVSKLISPIVDQINNDFGSSEEYSERIEKGVISCTQNLAKAITDHHLIKDLNYKILLKTRENSLKIRYQTLRILHCLILSLTEEYLPLLPETIPFLAELYEDDSEELQKLLLTVFNDIERIFGEPIASYF